MELLFDLKQLKELGGLATGNILSVDPELYSKFMKHLSRTVKRDEVTKNIVFLTALSAFTKNPINLFLRGESSIGKTYNVTEVLKYFPKKDVWLLGGLSPTALVHSKGVLVDANGEEIKIEDRPRKPLKSDYANERDFREAVKEYREAKRIWDERLKNSHYLVDLSHKILVFLEAPHIKTFNMLRPILSHDSFQISYKFTDKTAKGKLQTQHVVLQGFPATIFCTSEEKYVKDLATRSFTVTPEVSKQKIKDANMLSGEKASFPGLFVEDEDFTYLQSYINTLKGKLKELDCIIPYGTVLAENFPSQYARSMRDFQHVLTLIKTFALFHFAQRPCLKLNREPKFVLATIQDAGYILGLWKQIQETTETGAPGHVIRFFYDVFKPLSMDRAELYVEELVAEYNRQNIEKRSSSTVRRWLDFLCEIGYVDKRKDSDGRRNVYFLIKKEKETAECEIFSNSHIFSLENLKEWWERTKTIYARIPIFITHKIFDDKPIDIKDLFEKFYLRKNGVRAQVVSNGKNSGKEKTTSKICAFQKFTQSAVYSQLKSIIRLTTNVQGECAVCGKVGRMSWQGNLFEGGYVLFCGECGEKVLEKKREEGGV